MKVVKQGLKKIKPNAKAVKNLLYPTRPKDYKAPTFKESISGTISGIKQMPKDAKRIFSKENIKRTFNDPRAKKEIDKSVEFGSYIFPYGKAFKAAKKAVKGISSASKLMKRGK